MQTDLEAAGVDDLVADGALHQGEAELLILRVHRVLLPRLSTGKAHGCMRQHRLQRHRQVRQVCTTGETGVTGVCITLYFCTGDPQRSSDDEPHHLFPLDLTRLSRLQDILQLSWSTSGSPGGPVYTLYLDDSRMGGAALLHQSVTAAPPSAVIGLT